MNKQNMKLQAALKYFNEFHLPVIPWRHVYTTKEKKPTKKPYVSWKVYQKELPNEKEIVRWWTEWPDANVAIVTGPISHVVAFDSDDDKADEYFNGIMPDNLSCPVSQTPSGGKHYWFKSDASLKNATKINGFNLDFRGEGGILCCPPSIREDGKAYKFLPQLSIKEIEIPQVPESLLLLLKTNTNIIGVKPENIETMFEEGRRDADLFHVAHLIALGGGTEEEAMKVLVSIAKSWGEENLTDWLWDKVKSAFERKAQRQINISEEVRRYISLTNGEFCVKDCYNELIGLNSVKPVKNCENLRMTIRQVVHNLRVAGEITANSRKDGYYTRVDDKCDDMDITNVSIENHPLKLPLDLRNYVKIMPKNIIVAAGSKSSGKTAFNLNIAWLNRNHPEGLYYYNSEMAAEELRIRIDAFGENYPLSEWKKIKFKERTANFADIIKQKPNAIHIVDFLEIYDNFYEIGLMIRDIYDALNKGVAIVSIQKNAGASLGLGGGRSIEKARLYLSLDYGRMTITDAKLFEIRHINPRGWVLDYKLHDGCHYQKDQRDWHEPSEVIEGLNPPKRKYPQ